jgi:hypothetical protein
VKNRIPLMHGALYITEINRIFCRAI